MAVKAAQVVKKTGSIDGKYQNYRKPKPKTHMKSRLF
jgi:hypothetical protein